MCKAALEFLVFCADRCLGIWGACSAAPLSPVGGKCPLFSSIYWLALLLFFWSSYGPTKLWAREYVCWLFFACDSCPRQVPSVPADQVRAPAHVRVKQRMFPFFLRSRRAADQFPACLQVRGPAFYLVILPLVSAWLPQTLVHYRDHLDHDDDYHHDHDNPSPSPSPPPPPTSSSPSPSPPLSLPPWSSGWSWSSW